LQSVTKPLLDVLRGETRLPPPIWLMRQAGRYLPEYRAVRERAGDFLKLCLMPELAAEITLQPVRRFSFDAAILFSDILLIPYALGQRVWFVEGEGPRLEPIGDANDLARLEERSDLLVPVYEALARIKASLPPEVTLLGFCGAPWTVASYMIAGQGTPDQSPARLFAYRNPEAFAGLMDTLVESSARHLVRQLRAGADAVQVFDTWAGVLPPDELWRWCIVPTRRMITMLRTEIADAKVIAFPRGIGAAIRRYVDSVPLDALGLDWMIDLDFACQQVGRHIALQGNLDPLVLVAGGGALDRAVDEILEHSCARPFIFNLGHGILPQTPLAHVEQMLARVRGK